MTKYLMVIAAAGIALTLQGFGALGLPVLPIKPAAEPGPIVTINRVGKADRVSMDDVKRVRTISIRDWPSKPTVPEEIAYRALPECEPLVSPLADSEIARRARACAA